MDELITYCITDYDNQKPDFEKMEKYYKGETDAMSNYQMITDRSNNKTNCNYIKKFIKEEVAYILGNNITYVSKSGDKGIIKGIAYNQAHWSEKHDQNLLKKALTYGKSFELYYIGKDGDTTQFSGKLLTPLEGYLYQDEKTKLFLHFTEDKFTKLKKLDVYHRDKIEHYEFVGADYVLKSEEEHYFGDVPVGFCPVNEEEEDDTLFKDLKGLQDSYETNLSDITNEISDFRNAYLKLIGCTMDSEKFKELKKLGGLHVPQKGDIDWLIKNINDTFIQNTLKTVKENMYELANHINANEKLQSNTSSLALRTRLINLEQKCKDNSKAVYDCIKQRLRFMFIYLSKKGFTYDYRDIKVKFTPSIPQDDLMMAQIFSQSPEDLFSKRTMRTQYSFCDNPDEEEAQIEAERKEVDLDNIDGDDDE